MYASNDAMSNIFNMASGRLSTSTSRATIASRLERWRSSSRRSHMSGSPWRPIGKMYFSRKPPTLSRFGCNAMQSRLPPL